MKLQPLDISLINNDRSRESDNATSSFDDDSSIMGTTYRAEGLSIGQDYMRYEGTTLSSSLSIESLQLEDTVGRGACSVVKRARHFSTKEPLALKIFPIYDSQMREMLSKELRVLCSLQCDCLVKLIGAFFDVKDCTVNMVLEYMDRGSLEDLQTNVRTMLRSETPHSKERVAAVVPESPSAAIAFQILWGMGYLHYEQRSHRDIKPANVLINSAGQVKLSDFGIASRRMEGSQEMNLTVVGTTRYMSPERLRAKPYTATSDIWSLGLLILECVTGRSPFEGIQSLVELVQVIDECSVDDLVPTSLNKHVTQVLQSCLQKTPERRMPTDILISSPWFSANNINNVMDATNVMRNYIEDTFPKQDSSLLSSTAITAMKESEIGLGIYEGCIEK